MTQEEKLEESKRLYETANADQKYVLKSLFPELKESEDERIKKEMLTFFKGFYDNQMVKAVDVEPWIAWLEKQGEQKSTADNFESVLKHIMEEAIECGDTRNLKADAEMLMRLVQKPAWSEENERIIQNLLSLWKEVMIELTCCRFGLHKDEVVDFLKSLRPQNHWKPSDEQMDALLKLEEMHVLEHENNQENAHLYMVVKSIREQLLKLREE